MGIIHRDLKPHNILIDHKNKDLKIIDWGLAEFYHPDETLHRVGTKYFVPPELICGYKYYDYQLDIWSLGCIFAGMVSTYLLQYDISRFSKRPTSLRATPSNT